MYRMCIFIRPRAVRAAAALAAGSRGVHALDVLLVALLDVFPLDLEGGRDQPHVGRPHLRAQLHRRRHFELLKSTYTQNILVNYIYRINIIKIF